MQPREVITQQEFDIRYAAHQEWLAGCNESGRMDRIGRDFTRVTFPDCANLAGACLAGSDFSRTKLKNANLAGTYLASCKFIGTNLEGANLERANSVVADFSHADLTGIHCKGASFLGCEFYETIWPSWCDSLLEAEADELVQAQLMYWTVRRMLFHSLPVSAEMLALAHKSPKARECGLLYRPSWLVPSSES